MARAWRSLRVRLALLVAIAATPALVLATYGAIDARAQAAGHVGREMVRLAHLCATTQTRQLQITSELLAAVALTPDVRRGNEAATQELLDGLRRRFASYTILLLSDRDGGSRVLSPAGRPISILDRPYFQRILAGEPLAIGGYAIGRSSGKPSIHVAVPVLDDGNRLRGALVAGIDLAWIARITDEAGLSDQAQVTVIDHQGVVLSGSRPGSSIDPDLRQRLQAHAGIAIRREADGVERISGFDELHDLRGAAIGWVVVSEPLSHAYADIDQRLALGLALVLLTALSAAGVSLVLARRMVLRPAEALSAVAGRLASGELAARMPVSGQSTELGTVALAINALGEELERQEAERRRNTQEVYLAHRLLRTLVDAAPMAVYILDHQGRVARLWSRGAEQLLGWSADEAIGHHPPHVVPNRGSGEHPALLSAGQTIAGSEMTCRRKDGSLLRGTLFAAAVDAGDDVAMVCLIADTSEQQRLRDQVQQAQKMDAVGRLASGVAHDFNNLLAVILGHCELLQRRLTDPEHRSQLDTVIGASRRATALTGRLLGFVRGQSSNPVAVELGQHLDAALPLLRGLVGRQVRIELHATQAVRIVADPMHLDQVVMNLLINARDAGASCITLTLAAAGPRATLTVNDDGSGMDRTVLARLFEPFFTTKSSGTGLGLATVRSLVEGQGGTIAVDSTPGTGTCFTITLPLAGDDGGAPA